MQRYQALIGAWRLYQSLYCPDYKSRLYDHYGAIAMLQHRRLYLHHRGNNIYYEQQEYSSVGSNDINDPTDDNEDYRLVLNIRQYMLSMTMNCL